MTPTEPVGQLVPWRPTMTMQQQNARGEWIPAIPEALFVGWRLRRCRCNCGETFKDRVTYRGHYALVHILAVPR